MTTAAQRGESRDGGRPDIAVFLDDLSTGGTQRRLITLARAFRARGADVHFVLGRRAGGLLGELDPGIEVHELRRVTRGEARAAMLPLLARMPALVPAFLLDTSFLASIKRVPALRDHLARARPRVLLAALARNNLAAIWAGRLAGVATRLVVNEVSTLSLEAAAGRTGFDARLPQLAGRWYGKAAAVVAVSEGVATDLAAVAGLERQRITVIHNPVDGERLRAWGRVWRPPSWFSTGGAPVVLAVGRLEPQKDFATLIRVFAILRRRCPARLVILGEGSQRAELEGLALRLGVAADVALPGQVPPETVAGAMARAAVLALSSAWEGMPNVLIEALACGCPVVATDCPHGPREILRAGAVGSLVPVGDAEAMAAAIEQTLASPQPAPALLARSADFDLDRIAAQWLALLLPGCPPGSRDPGAATRELR